VQAHTDGAIARYFTTEEWRNLASESFDVEKIFICGSKSDVVPLPGGTNQDKCDETLSRLPESIFNESTEHGHISDFKTSKKIDLTELTGFSCAAADREREFAQRTGLSSTICIRSL